MPACLQPARISFTPEGIPYAQDYDDAYHAPYGAFKQAHHVFLAGNELPGRWHGRQHFCVLETGFGLGNNFLATWQAWEQDPQRCGHLHFISIEKHPLSREDLTRVHAGSPWPEGAAELVAQWPVLARGFHHLHFAGHRVSLTLVFDDIAQAMPELAASVDAFYLDGFAPAKNPAMWSTETFRHIERLAAPGSTAATWSSARVLKDGLRQAQFEVSRMPGTGGKRHVCVGRFQPAYTPRRLAAQLPHPMSEPGLAHADPASTSSPSPLLTPAAASHPAPHALVVGAGMAGCSAARALALQGWQVTLVDALAGPAQATSGNPAGLFHATFNHPDGPHAQWSRLSALHLQRWARPRLAAGSLPGAIDGMLRLEQRLAPSAVQAQLAAEGWPSAVVDFLEGPDAAQWSASQSSAAGWRFAAGGWMSPPALCLAMLDEIPDGRLQRRWQTEVDALSPRDDGQTGWQALLRTATGEERLTVDAVVMAQGRPDTLSQAMHWPLSRERGQVSWTAHSPGHPPLRHPVSGAGYALPPVHLPGRKGPLHIFGSSGTHTEGPACTMADHALNWQKSLRLHGAPDLPMPEVEGRVGWRCVADDKLPLVGALPDEDLLIRSLQGEGRKVRMDQVRMLPRRPGLMVLTGLGGRGLTWSLLAGELLASWLTGSPCPVPQSLRDALDPARFWSRAWRKGWRPTLP